MTLGKISDTLTSRSRKHLKLGDIFEHFKPWLRTRCTENVLLRLSFQYENQQKRISYVKHLYISTSATLFLPSPETDFSGIENVGDHLSSAARDSTIINKGAGRSVDLNCLCPPASGASERLEISLSCAGGDKLYLTEQGSLRNGKNTGAVMKTHRNLEVIVLQHNLVLLQLEQKGGQKSSQTRSISSEGFKNIRWNNETLKNKKETEKKNQFSVLSRATNVS